MLHLEEKGRGRALRAAWARSDAPVLAYLDVDLSTDLAALLPLVAPLVTGHSDLAIGTRLARGSRVVRGAKREVISRCYNLLLRGSLRGEVLRRAVRVQGDPDRCRQRLLPLVEDDGWFFDTELLVLAERSGLRIHEVPVDWVDDPDSRVDIVATALEDLRGHRPGRPRPWSRGRAAAGPDPRPSSGRRRRRRRGRVPVWLAVSSRRFAGVGVVSTLAYLLLFIALRARLGAQPANLVALLVTAVANTAVNRRLTFGVRGRDRRGPAAGPGPRRLRRRPGADEWLAGPAAASGWRAAAGVELGVLVGATWPRPWCGSCCCGPGSSGPAGRCLIGGRLQTGRLGSRSVTADPPDTPPADIHTTAGKLADLHRRNDEAIHAGSARAVEKQHARGKKTARERIEALLDAGSFVEIDELARHRSTNFGLENNRPFGDGVITGYGTVDGRRICVFSQDVTVFGGSLGQVYGEKIVKVLDLALKTGCPIIGINEGGGARIQEGVVSLGLYGEIFYRNVASGVIPQISMIMGAAAGGHVYSPALTDFTVMVDEKSHMFITGPDVISTVTGEDVGSRSSAAPARTTPSPAPRTTSPATRTTRSTTSRRCSPTCPATTWTSRRRSTRSATGSARRTRSSTSSSPTRRTSPTTCTTIVEHLLDGGEFCEVQALFAPNIIVGFGRIEGHSVGIVANQPMQFAGCLDIDASEKAARFVRTCDAFNVPVLTLVDVPGFLPGIDQEWDGIIRRGAKLIYAYAEATVPKVTVITRKAFGGAYDVMGSKHLGADVNVAWPTAQIAVMGAQGAVTSCTARSSPTPRTPMPCGSSGSGVRGHPAQPVRRRRAGLRRLGHPAVAHPQVRHQRAADAAQQAPDAAAEEARQHPAVTTTPPADAGLFAVLRGQPTDDDLAALTVVLLDRLAATAAAAAAAPAGRPAPSGWLDRATLLRGAPHAGAGSWRRSGLPG